MKKIITILTVLISLSFITVAECQPVEEKDVVSNKSSERITLPDLDELNSNLDRDLRLDYISLRSKQARFLAGGFVFLAFSIGNDIGTGFAYNAYDKARKNLKDDYFGITEDSKLKEKMGRATAILGITTGITFVTSMIFFGVSDGYRKEANKLRDIISLTSNGFIYRF